MKKRLSYFFLAMLLCANATMAKITLPRFVSNGMVLQRNMPIPIWGWADEGEKITINFNGKVYHAIAGADKKWQLKLAIQKAGGPFDMTLAGSNSIQIKNILIGDVWLCSGQSNMEYELYKASEKYPDEIKNSTNDQIRHFLVKRRIAFNNSNDIESDKGWESANPVSVLNFTAVGYFFAKNLFEKYKVPIGLINCSYGGTPAEAWMNEKELLNFPAQYDNAIRFKDSVLVKNITSKDKIFTDSWNSKTNKGDQGTAEKWYQLGYNSTDWNSVIIPGFWQEQGLKEVEAGVVWYTKEITIPASVVGKNAILHLGNIVMKDNTYVNGIQVGTTSNKYAPRKYTVAANLLKEGKNTICIRILNEVGNGGFISDKPYKLVIGDSVFNLTGNWKCKLGINTKPLLREDNTRFQDQASSMYHGMLAPLIGIGIKGVTWYQGESNVSRANEYRTVFSSLINSWRKEWGQGDFPFLFVQLANINPAKNMPAESKLATLQEAQQLTLSLPNTGMSVTNDIGEWNDVHPMNKAVVGKRLALVAEKVAYHEKKLVFAGPTYESMKIKGNKIELTFSNIGSGMISKGATELAHFAITDAGNKYVWAKAEIKGDKIIVWNDAVAAPIAVRYAWADNPAGANLYNKEGLPASCFRTDKNNK